MLLELLSRSRCIVIYLVEGVEIFVRPDFTLPAFGLTLAWRLSGVFFKSFWKILYHKEPSLFLFPTFFTNLLPKTIQSSILTAALQEFRPVGYQTSILYSNEDTSLILVHRVGYYTLEFSMLTSVE